MRDAPDVQPPEFIADCVGHDGLLHRVPFLVQRDGETLEMFIERVKRVEEAINV